MRLILFTDSEGKSYSLTIEYHSFLDNSNFKGFYLWELNKVYVNKTLYDDLVEMPADTKMQSMVDNLLKLSNEEFLSMQFGEYDVKFLRDLKDIDFEDRTND